MSGEAQTREDLDAAIAAVRDAARKVKCGDGGHLPLVPVADRLVDAVPYSIRCDCGGYSWLPVRRGAVEVTTP